MEWFDTDPSLFSMETFSLLDIVGIRAVSPRSRCTRQPTRPSWKLEENGATEKKKALKFLYKERLEVHLCREGSCFAAICIRTYRSLSTPNIPRGIRERKLHLLDVFLGYFPQSCIGPSAPERLPICIPHPHLPSPDEPSDGCSQFPPHEQRKDVQRPAELVEKILLPWSR